MEKYEETIAELHSRGLDVFSFDWRGQGLSDRMLPEPQKGFVRHYDDYLEDLDLMLEAIVRPGLRGRLCLLGHSMGGHIGLRALFRYDDLFERAVFCSPMVDIITDPFPPVIARWLTRIQMVLGNASGIVVGAAKRTPFPKRFEDNLWTLDRARFERTRKRITAHPELSAAMVTYGWVAATTESVNALKRDARGHSPKTPVLIHLAGDDQVVSNQAARKLAASMGNVRMIEIKGARHEILQETDCRRTVFWQAFDEFMGL
jgi:lysophospholipase